MASRLEILSHALLALGVLAGVLGSHPAVAGTMPTQNRLHLGVSGVEGPSPLGLTGGLDSRLTRFVYVDAGGFRALLPLEDGLDLPSLDPGDAFIVRHGLFLSPGVRIPHVQPKSFTYDLLIRGGVAALWLANLDPEVSTFDESTYGSTTVASGFAGLELHAQVGHFGTRLGYRHYFAAPYYEAIMASTLLASGQVSLEAVYQIGAAR